MTKKKTTIEFAKQVLSLGNGDYRLLSKYNGAHKVVKIKHLSCGTIFKMKPNSFLNGQRCTNKKCRTRLQQQTTWNKSYNKLLKYIKDNHLEDSYILLTNRNKFRGIDKKVAFYHAECNQYIRITPHAFEQGERCRTCSLRSRARKRRNPNGMDIIKKGLGKDYVIVTTEYLRNRQEITVEHIPCKNRYTRSASTFLIGDGKCPYCFRKRGLMDKTLLSLLANYNCVLLDGLKKVYHNQDKVNLRCLTCGNKICVRISRVRIPRSKLGLICKFCNRRVLGELKQKSNAEFLREFNQRPDSGEYQIIGVYNGAHTKIKVKHLLCGKEYKVEAHSLLNGYRCNKCTNIKKSLGESLVTSYLDELGFTYEYPKKFPDLVDKKELHYDFYIPSKRVLIEYQGIQHYNPSEYFGGLDEFKVRQKHDQMKRDYAIKNNYTLIEIPYSYNYREILKRIRDQLSFLND